VTFLAIVSLMKNDSINNGEWQEKFPPEGIYLNGMANNNGQEGTRTEMHS
jgi:hypothetical protein